MSKKFTLLLILLAVVAGVYLLITGERVDTNLDNEIEDEQIQVDEGMDEYSFVEEGVMVYGNPGMEEGVYYLVYDKPGAPGANVKLVFQEDSECKVLEEGDCSSISEAEDKRVKVYGVPVNEGNLS